MSAQQRVQGAWILANVRTLPPLDGLQANLLGKSLTAQVAGLLRDKKPRRAMRAVRVFGLAVVAFGMAVSRVAHIVTSPHERARQLLGSLALIAKRRVGARVGVQPPTVFNLDVQSAQGDAIPVPTRSQIGDIAPAFPIKANPKVRLDFFETPAIAIDKLVEGRIHTPDGNLNHVARCAKPFHRLFAQLICHNVKPQNCRNRKTPA